MAGRGRGRGRGMSFKIENLGIERLSDVIGAPTVQPPPLFPPTNSKLMPLKTGEQFDYMVALKQNLRASMSALIASKDGLKIDYDRVPRELRPSKRKIAQPAAKKRRLIVDVEAKLNAFEAQDSAAKPAAADGERQGSDTENENAEKEADNEVVEPELSGDDEDETDYMQNYFDNGEAYLDEDGSGAEDDGPVY